MCININLSSTHKVSIEFWQNINEGLFKVVYLIKLRQHFGNIAKAVMRSHKKFFSKVSKILAEGNKVFNSEKSLIYVLPEFN